MTDRLYKRLYSIKNLELAWTRLKTAQNIYYKNFYRELFLAYDINSLDNLKNLSSRIKGKSYKPSRVMRFYTPKSSGLHRPITFLGLDDLIVYQAFVNVIAKKFDEQRKPLENVNVFSNLLNRNEDKELFFFKKWQEGYEKYIKKIKDEYNSGYKWIAHFDLAAYFDTICHTTLADHISKSSFTEFKSLLIKCLNEWSSPRLQKLGHGIPQGPISSSLIAETYLIPIDKRLNEKGLKYIRYVDDIKILGKSREEVLNGIILLERECKERGLIPQSKKYEIAQATSVEEAILYTASLSEDERRKILDEDSATKLFKEAISLENKNKTKIKYILRASGQNKYIFEYVINNFNNFPEFSYEFSQFMLNYAADESIAELIYNNALKNPSQYEYVEGIYWDLLSKCKINSHLKRAYIKKAINRLRDNPRNFALKYGLYSFISTTRNGLVLRWLQYEKSPLLQAFSIKNIHVDCFDTPTFIEFAERILRRTYYEPGAMLMKKLIFSFRKDIQGSLGKPAKDYSGVISNLQGSPKNIDSIGELLTTRYNISQSSVWKSLLDSDFTHANELLYMSDKSFHIDKNSWISYLDSFNDLIFRHFISLITSKVTPQRGKHWPVVVDRNGKNIDFGILLDVNNQISKVYPDISDGFRTFHERRNKTPTSHAFDKKTGLKTQIILSYEQKALNAILKKSYNTFIAETIKII